MPDDRWERVKSVFAEAVDLPLSKRAPYLDAACGEDRTLRVEVESMLLADQVAPSFLEAPLPALLNGMAPGRGRGEDCSPELPPGTKAGGFTVERLLARGGMGAVYLARQASPERLVALKVTDGTADSPELMRRFAQESQALARLQHPGIAQVIETGEVILTREGSATTIPFIAMEFVEGVAITEFAVGLTREAKIGLLTQVCDAVEHAHQRGVIHRDLKPGNILVDASGRVRVLDFGVARLTQSGGNADAGPATSVAGIVGTIPYMSPEQVAGDPADIDTRSDVYALGVVACEVLTGRLPYARRPITIIDAVDLIAGAQLIRPSQLDRSLRGDWEGVLLCALTKDPERRYQSAGAFAWDLRRLVDREPVSVIPPTATYLLRSFVRRHRSLVIASALTLTALALGTGVSTWQAIKATRAERESTRHVQKLAATAGGLLDEVYWPIYSLPQSADARIAVAIQAVDLLEALGTLTPTDLTIQLRRAEGWRRLGSTYGAPGNANLHNRAKALECFDRAIAIAERAHVAMPRAFGPVDALATCWEGRSSVGRTLAEQLADMDRSVSVAEQLWRARETLPPSEQRHLARRLSRSLSVRASYTSGSDEGIQDARRAVLILKSLGDVSDLSPVECRELTLAYRYLADATSDSVPAESEAAARAVLDLLQRAPHMPEFELLRCAHGGAARVLLGRLSASSGWNEDDINAARTACEDLEAFLAEDTTNDFRCRVLAEVLPAYADMWLRLAAHPDIDEKQRARAATLSSEAVSRGVALWEVLHDHDQIGPADAAMERLLEITKSRLADLPHTPP